MLDLKDKRDFLDAFDQALNVFTNTNDDIVCVDTKESNVHVNALILIRGKGFTYTMLKGIYKIMDHLDRKKAKL